MLTEVGMNSFKSQENIQIENFNINIWFGIVNGTSTLSVLFITDIWFICKCLSSWLYFYFLLHYSQFNSEYEW